MHTILGIDPGTIKLGYGVLAGSDARPQYLAGGTLQVSRSWTLARRLATLQVALKELCDTHHPSAIALESSFHGKSIASLIRLGEARGMVVALGGSLEIPVFDYAPARVKKAVTGRGNAGKEAVARMIGALIPAATDIDSMDQTDALAIALCHLHRCRIESLTRRLPPPSRRPSTPLSKRGRA